MFTRESSIRSGNPVPRSLLRRLKVLTLAGLMTCASSAAWASWPVNMDGDGSPDGAKDVIVDPAGHVVAVGEVGGEFTVTRRYQSSGNEIWTTTLSFSGAVASQASAVAVDAAGNVFAAGTVDHGSTRDICIAKLESATGAVLWQAILNEVPGLDNVVFDIAVDAAGDAFACGYVPGLDQTSGTRLATFKLDGAGGAVIWQRLVEGEDPEAPNGLYPGLPANFARELALDSAGDVIVAGSLTKPSNTVLVDQGQNFAVLKLDGMTGADVWAYRPESDLGFAFAVAVDSGGDVVAGGQIHVFGGEVTVFNAVKISGSSGQEMWAYEWSDPQLYVYDLDLTTSGDVIAAGRASGSFTGTALVRLGGSNGHEQWVHRLGGVITTWLTLTLDSRDDIYMTGIYDPLHPGDLNVRKFDGASGADVWNRHFDGDAQVDTLDERGEAITLDTQGHVYVAGNLENQGAGSDFSVIRTSVDRDFGSLYAFFHDFNHALTPIWEDPLIWVFGYADVEQLVMVVEEAVLSQEILGDAIVTTDAEALLAYPDRVVLLQPEDEAETVMWISENRGSVYGERSAPFALFLREDGEGREALNELVELGRWGPPLDAGDADAGGEFDSAVDGTEAAADATADPGGGEAAGAAG